MKDGVIADFFVTKNAPALHQTSAQQQLYVSKPARSGLCTGWRDPVSNAAQL
ncbi:hypothetical protein ACLK1S_20230 [Escherichia coli]